MIIKTDSEGKCQAQGGPATCEDTDCPEGGAAKQEVAAKLGVIADYSKFHPKLAIAFNDAFANTKQMLPDIKLPGVTSADDAYSVLAQKGLYDLNQDPDYDVMSPETKKELAYRLAEHAAEKIKKAAESSNFEMEHIGSYDVICVPKQNTDDYQKLEERTAQARKEGKVSVGSVQGLINHEIAHGINNQLGISNIPEVRTLYKAFVAYSNPSHLSMRAMSDIDEFISEGWGEYMSEATPRPIAQYLGKTIIDKYNEMYPER